MDQRNKGFKPPFVRNRSQTYQQEQTTQGEHKMTNSLAKKPIQQPIKCWGCEEDHLYKYCPQKGDRMRTMHSIHEVDTLDDVVRSMSRIYVDLDKRQEDYQSHVIKV